MTGKLTDRCSRTPWQGDQTSIMNVRSKGEINDEGYVNIATELGLSGTRGEYLLFFLLTIAVLIEITQTILPTTNHGSVKGSITLRKA